MRAPRGRAQSGTGRCLVHVVLFTGTEGIVVTSRVSVVWQAATARTGRYDGSLCVCVWVSASLALFPSCSSEFSPSQELSTRWSARTYNRTSHLSKVW